jgi:REP element-mobilizing transposase RayT
MSNHRALLPDGLFHVYGRGVPERPIFLDDDDRHAFLALLDRAAASHRITIHARCLMTTHYHAVVGAACLDLSRGMQWLLARYATGFNRRHGRFGHLFAERFSTRAIEGEEHLHDACAYVLLNPVKAGLCDRIADWPWSFFRGGLDRL